MMRKFGSLLALVGMLFFLCHVEHGEADHSKNLKDHDCICHTTGMTSPAAIDVASSVTIIDTLRVAAVKFEARISPLFLNSPRAPPAA